MSTETRTRRLTAADEYAAAADANTTSNTPETRDRLAAARARYIAVRDATEYNHSSYPPAG